MTKKENYRGGYGDNKKENVRVYKMSYDILKKRKYRIITVNFSV